MLPSGGIRRIVALAAGGLLTYGLAAAGYATRAWQLALILAVSAHVIQAALVLFARQGHKPRLRSLPIVTQTAGFALMVWAFASLLTMTRYTAVARWTFAVILCSAILAIFEELSRRLGARA
jgi:hypothetical protein